MPLRHKDTKKHKEILVKLCAFVPLWREIPGLLNSNYFSLSRALKNHLVTGLFIFIIPLSLFSQTSQALKPASMVNTTIQFKARYIFNFTKYIEWPANLRKGNFVIGVIGSPDLFRELIKISETKQIGNQPLEVKTFSSVESITYCHILYVVTDKVDIITAIQNKINSENTLLITDREGMIKLGAGINFVVINNKLEFELNRTGIQKVGLSVGSGLALLAVTVL